jgi:hypothetical protein
MMFLVVTTSFIFVLTIMAIEKVFKSKFTEYCLISVIIHILLLINSFYRMFFS